LGSGLPANNARKVGSGSAPPRKSRNAWPAPTTTGNHRADGTVADHALTLLRDHSTGLIKGDYRMPRLKTSDGIDLEQDLDSVSLRNLCALGSKRVFAPNEHLYRQGEAAKLVFVLLSGSVKSTSTHAHGFDTLLKIHGPGSLLGLSALRPNGFRDANGIAIGEIRTTCFSSDLFLRILENDGALGILLIRILLKRQQQLHGRIRNILGNSVEQRLADVLLQLSAEAAVTSDDTQSPEISITHEDLASLVISRRQYVTQIMREFVANGLIVTARKRVRVIDPERLQQIADA
jgi:CRP-like cAMP-binding protein